MKSNTLAAFALGSAVAIAAFFAGNAEARRIPAMFAPPSAIGVMVASSSRASACSR